MRINEEGKECPATLGEYRAICVAIGGETCGAVKWLDEIIASDRDGLNALVIASDAEMRKLLMPKLAK
jgi:hypothetical protein